MATPEPQSPSPDVKSLQPFPYLMWLFLTVLPLLMGSLALSLLGPLGSPISDEELCSLRWALSTEPFLPGALSLVTILTVHVSVCLVGAWIGAATLHRIYKSWWPAALIAAAGLLVWLLIIAWSNKAWPVYRLSYYFFTDVYKGTGAGSSLLQPRIGELDALTIAVILPVTFGIGGLMLLAAAALARVQDAGKAPPPPCKLYEAKLLFAYAGLKRSFYLLSLGLVTSTIAASLFFHLPSKLSAGSVPGTPSAISLGYDVLGKAETEKAVEEAAAAAKLTALRDAELASIRGKIDAFAGELSVFWAAIFTLTLLAGGGFPLVLLQRKIRRYTERPDRLILGRAAQDRLDKSGLAVGWNDKVKLLLALIAPLATGPISNFVQAATG